MYEYIHIYIKRKILRDWDRDRETALETEGDRDKDIKTKISNTINVFKPDNNGRK